MFDKMKQLYDFQKKAKEIQKELESRSIEVSRENGKIRVIFDGSQKMKSIAIEEELLTPQKKELLERLIRDAVSEAIQQSQKLAAGKMKELTGGMGIPGM